MELAILKLIVLQGSEGKVAWVTQHVLPGDWDKSACPTEQGLEGLDTYIIGLSQAACQSAGSHGLERSSSGVKGCHANKPANSNLLCIGR